MKRSKLEEYVSILQILQMHGPVRLADIESLIREESSDIKEALTFLQEQNAIEETLSYSGSAFVATPLGNRIVKYFGFSASMKKPLQ